MSGEFDGQWCRRLRISQEEHGLAPYFKETLEHDIQKCPACVVCFDEALNKISRRGQLGIVIRYWSTDANQVATRYFNSGFLGYATAVDLK